MSGIEEYPPGERVPGRDRADGRGVEARVAGADRARRDGAPNVLFFVLDDVGYGQLSSFGGLVETPNIDRVAGAGPALREHAHDGALLADALLHPHRPQPPLQRRGLHHGAGDGLSRLRRADAVRERDAARDAARARLQHLLRRQVAPVARRRTTRPPGPFHRWPLGRGFERFYGFLGGETNQWYPDLTRDNALGAPAARPEDGLPPERGPRRPGDQDGPRRARQRAREAVLHVLRARRGARARTTSPAEWADRYKGAFDDGWDAYRETVFARQKELGLLPADAELSPRDPDVPEWDSLSADERRLYARMMEVYAGFLSARRPPLRPHPRHARADRRAREHDRSWSSPTTARRPRAA